MIDIEQTMQALKVFGNNTILYNSTSGEIITFKDVIDFVKAQESKIAQYDKLVKLQQENINTTHANNMKLREEVERITAERQALIRVCDNCPKVITDVAQAVQDITERFADELEYVSEYFDMGDGYIYKAVHIEDIYKIKNKIMEELKNE